LTIFGFKTLQQLISIHEENGYEIQSHAILDIFKAQP
jgi:hypothetical protein